MQWYRPGHQRRTGDFAYLDDVMAATLAAAEADLTLAAGCWVRDGGLRRGEVWRYQGISRSRPVLVVSCDELNDAEQPIVVDVTSFNPQAAATLLTVRVGDELGGYTRCRTISVGDSKRFTELLGTIPESTMEQVDMALRAALNL